LEKAGKMSEVKNEDDRAGKEKRKREKPRSPPKILNDARDKIRGGSGFNNATSHPCTEPSFCVHRL
jgi:hypothetical protein